MRLTDTLIVHAGMAIIQGRWKMEYPVEIEGFSEKKVALRTATLLAGPVLTVNGEPAPKGPGKNQYLLTGDRGEEVTVELKNTFLIDPVPQLLINGTIVSVAEPLAWYEWVWCCVPLVLIFLGGAIGGGLGALATYGNLMLFRSRLQVYMKYGIAACITTAAFILWLIMAVAISLFLGRR